jgi:hypothetical protein
VLGRALYEDLSRRGVVERKRLREGSAPYDEIDDVIRVIVVQDTRSQTGSDGLAYASAASAAVAATSTRVIGLRILTTVRVSRRFSSVNLSGDIRVGLAPGWLRYRVASAVSGSRDTAARVPPGPRSSAHPAPQRRLRQIQLPRHRAYGLPQCALEDRTLQHFGAMPQASWRSASGRYPPSGGKDNVSVSAAPMSVHHAQIRLS